MRSSPALTLLLIESQMNRATLLAVVMFVASVSFESLCAQQRATEAEPTNSLLSKVEGTWQPTEVSINGQSSKLSPLYGPSVFVANTWTMQTTNGDHVYEISSVNERGDPTDATFVDKIGRRVFVGLIHLDGDTLTIARGLQWTRDKDGNAQIPRPDSLIPGRDKIVYTWKRAPVTVDVPKRRSLTIRMFDEGTPDKILAECTIEAYFGGKLNYEAGTEVSPEFRARSQAFGRRPDNPIKLGTRVTGSIEETGSGETHVSVEIQLASAVPSDNPESAIVRAESLMLQTALKPNEEKRINCGGNRWCHLVLQ